MYINYAFSITEQCRNETESRFMPTGNSTLSTAVGVPTANSSTSFAASDSPTLTAVVPADQIQTHHAPNECAKVDQENAELKRKLIRTKRAFEETYQKLRISNQRKALVEKDIKNQILKTHNVLRNVRSNMENEL